MRTLYKLSALAAAVVLAGACGRSIEIQTMAAPDAGLSELHSFRVLPGPARRDGRIVSGNDDPMISNSIANRTLRERIAKAFVDRGYAIDERKPDFGVAFYATAQEKLDVSTWDYGYPFRPRWGVYGPPAPMITQYTEGSVIIDVVKPVTGELLWRGVGKAELIDGPDRNLEQLAKAAEAIVGRFPHGTARVVATRF
jgi:Domain of unknown function (DUF4136)